VTRQNRHHRCSIGSAGGNARPTRIKRQDTGEGGDPRYYATPIFVNPETPPQRRPESPLEALKRPNPLLRPGCPHQIESQTGRTNIAPTRWARSLSTLTHPLPGAGLATIALKRRRSTQGRPGAGLIRPAQPGNRRGGEPLRPHNPCNRNNQASFQKNRAPRALAGQTQQIE